MYIWVIFWARFFDDSKPSEYRMTSAMRAGGWNNNMTAGGWNVMTAGGWTNMTAGRWNSNMTAVGWTT